MRFPLSLARQLLILIALLVALSGCTALKQSLKATPSLANAMGMADIPMKDLEKKYFNRDSKWIEVGGLNIHYRDVGEGHPVVLVHGIFSSLQTWDGWVDELRRTHRVITLDVPGYGLTGPIPEDLGYSDESLLSLFAQFVDALELHRFAIVGNSMGGYIAATYAAQYPERVSKLILLDPIGYPQETPWIFDFATAPGMSTIGRYIAPPVLVTLNLQDVYGDPKRITKDTIDRYVQMSQRPGAKGSYMDTLIALEARSHSDAPLPFFNIKAPTLLMWGEADRWVPLSLSERWKADLPQAHLITYPGVGHIPMEEIPEQSVQDAAEFLADLGRQPAAPEPETKPQEKMQDLENILQGGGEGMGESSGGMGEMAPMEF